MQGDPVTTCRWDRDAADYLTHDGDPCRTDDHGDPTHHCTSRRTCSWHVGPTELTCARCLGEVRRDIRWIVTLTALIPVAAEAEGIDSEVAHLAGPAADPEAWSWRKVAANQGRGWHLSLEEDDDETHPEAVLGRAAHIVAETYGHNRPPQPPLAWSAGYLDRQLPRIAQDATQDFALLRREVRKCRQHLETVLHNDTRPDRGAPCPECTDPDRGVGPRLVRAYGHWCEDPDCCRVHYRNDAGDVWACPADRDHAWTHEDYERWIEERRERIGA
jgi:hypothetical protein